MVEQHELIWDNLYSIGRALQDVDSKTNNYLRFFENENKYVISQKIITSIRSWVPQIAVIGSQSCGKTSLIEALCGLPPNTLPIGQGIVTRVPLQISVHLISNKTGSETGINSNDENNEYIPCDDTGWITFDHKSSEKFRYEDTSNEIVRRTDEILRNEYPDLDPKYCISPTPVSMHIYSSRATAEMSFIDLPGLTRVPVQGQPLDLCHRLRGLVKSIISAPNIIILSLSPLNTDLANSEALSLAREVDKGLDRTIGVLTKVDLLEDGVDISSLLTNLIYPLKLGYFAVLSDGDGGVQRRTKTSDKRGYCGIQNEINFYDTHKAYRTVDYKVKSRCGLSNLVQFIVSYMCQVMERHIPAFKRYIEHRMAEVESQIIKRTNPLTRLLPPDVSQIGETVDDQGEVNDWNAEKLKPILLDILSNFGRDFNELIEGRISTTFGSDHHLIKKKLSGELFGGARIQKIFSSVFRTKLEAIDAMEGLSSREIGFIIQNANGVRPSLFVPDQAFESLARRQIRLFERPALECVDMVYQELMSLFEVTESLSPQLQFFPLLSKEINSVCKEILNKARPVTKKMVIQLIEIEISFIHTYNPSFNTAILQGFNTHNYPHHGQNNDMKIDNSPSSRTAMGDKIAAIDDINEENYLKFIEQNEDYQRNIHTTVPPPSIVAKHPVINLFQRRSVDEIRWMKRLIRQYLTIIRNTLLDFIPKTIMRYMVLQTKETMSYTLIQKLYHHEKVQHLLTISDSVLKERERYCKEQMLLKEISGSLKRLSDEFEIMR